MFLFGRKKEPPKPSTVENLQKMKAHTDTMEKRIQFVSQKMAAEHAAAKEFTRKKDKRSAMMALKKKKLYEKEVSQLEQTQFSLTQQIAMVESAIASKDTVGMMKLGQQAMSQVQREMGGVDAVTDTMDEVADAMADQQEIGEVLAQGFGDPMGLNDHDFEAELAELEDEDLDLQLAGIGAVPLTQPAGVRQQQPAAAAAAPAPQAVSSEDAELERQLAAMMAA